MQGAIVMVLKGPSLMMVLLNVLSGLWSTSSIRVGQRDWAVLVRVDDWILCCWKIKVDL